MCQFRGNSSRHPLDYFHEWVYFNLVTGFWQVDPSDSYSEEESEEEELEWDEEEQGEPM